MSATQIVQHTPSFLAFCLPVTFAVAALSVSRLRPFREAMFAAWLAAALAVLAVASRVFIPPSLDVGTSPSTLPTALASAVRLDVVGSVMLLLVGALAVVVVRYSRTYLQGDPGQPRYYRSLFAALSAVTVLITSNDLAVIVLAWIATSLAVHQLLTFYDARPQALIAAHKKFLLSRLADACMVSAVWLVMRVIGSVNLDVIDAWVSVRGSLPPSLQVATVLLVLGVSLKSAQLPFHGWLIQVMEAPTPVSALLHAGIVNIGGFVMIRLAPLMGHAPIAQGLLVAIGMTTAVIASLVMTTRVSVKVALAWSTCAQMGFMLVQCGLGAWHLALLHLVAHSLYKAHAFLSSGTRVDGWRSHSIVTRSEPASLAGVLGASVALLAGMGAVVAVMTGTGAFAGHADPTLAPLAVLLCLSLSPMVARGVSDGWSAALGTALRSAGVTALYFGWHAVGARMLPSASDSASSLGWIFVASGFALLFVLQAVLQSQPEGRLARALQPRLFAGLYLDEVVTRMTFRVWPPRLNPAPAPSDRINVAKVLEVRT